MVDQTDKKRVKELFNEYLDVQDQRKNLNETNKELTEEAAKILDVNKTTASKLFKFMEKKVNKGEDELDTIQSLLLELGDG